MRKMSLGRPLTFLAVGALLTNFVWQSFAEEKSTRRDFRTWTGKNGHSMRARFVRLEGLKVVLVKEAGGDMRTALLNLSDADLAYVSEVTTPPTIQSGPTRLDFTNAKQSVTLQGLEDIPEEWSYELCVTQIRTPDNVVKLPPGKTNRATLKQYGTVQLPVNLGPIAKEFGNPTVTLSLRLTRYKGTLSVDLQPTVKLGEDNQSFASAVIRKDGIALQKSIASDLQKFRNAKQLSNSLPGDIRSLRSSFWPVDRAGAQQHNTMVTNNLGRSESKLESSQRMGRKLEKAIPRKQFKYKLLEALHAVVDAHTNKIEICYEVTRRVGPLTHVVFIADEKAVLNQAP